MHLTQRSIILYSFTEVNPDKGTETLLYFSYKDLTSSKFTEVNPDKGTETREEELEDSLTDAVYRS